MKNVIILLGILLTSQVNAQDHITWTKKGLGFWDNAANWDLNRLPIASDTVSILSDTVFIPNNYIAMARHLELGDPMEEKSVLVIFDTGVLEILGTNSSIDLGMIIRNGLFRNNGCLKISNCLKGITIDSVSIVENTDSVIFESCRNLIVNANLLVNEVGAVLFSDVRAVSGIENLDTFQNQGTVIFGDAGSESETKAIVMSSNSYLQNDGLIYAEHYTYALSLVQCIFVNNGMLHIDNGTFGIEFTDNTYQIFNHDSIIVNDLNSFAVSGNFSNYSKFIVEDLIFSVSLSGGHFVNEFTAEMQLEDFADHGLALSSGAIFENFGNITIDSMAGDGIHIYDGLTSGAFINYGIIDIMSCNLGIGNESNFTNIGGEIKMINLTTFGFENQGLFRNQDFSTVDINSAVNGLKLWPGSVTEFQATTSLNLDNSTSVPLDVILGAVFDVSGSITIGN